MSNSNSNFKEKSDNDGALCQLSMNDLEAELSHGSQTPVLAKSFNLLSACTTGMTTGNVWAVLGGGIVCDFLVLRDATWTANNLGHLPLQRWSSRRHI